MRYAGPVKVRPPSTDWWIESFVAAGSSVTMASTKRGSFGSMNRSRVNTLEETVPPARVQVHPPSAERQKATKLVASTVPSLPAL